MIKTAKNISVCLRREVLDVISAGKALPALILAQEASQHFFFPEPVLLIPYRQIHPGFLIDHASLMCEAFNPSFHDSIPCRFLRHRRTGIWLGGEVDDGIVDAAAAKMASGKDFSFWAAGSSVKR